MNKDQLKSSIEKAKKVTGKILTIGTFLAWTGLAEASFSITHTGATDPANEGFVVSASIGSATAGPVYNDIGHDAWSITGYTPYQQYAYNYVPLSLTQQTDIMNQGFVLTVVERVLQGGAPVYTSLNPAVIGAVAISTGTRRFDIDLGVNSDGNTVVVLPDSIYSGGAGLIAPGASYTLVDSGSSYHNYKLVYDSATQLSNLFVDGIERIQNYAGFTYPTTALYSLNWSGINGGQANFSSIQYASSPIPIPATIWLFGSALSGLSFIRRTKKST